MSLERYCQQVLNETVRTAKLTPVAARLQEVEGKVDQHVIPKEVSGFLLSAAVCLFLFSSSGSYYSPTLQQVYCREALRGEAIKLYIKKSFPFWVTFGVAFGEISRLDRVSDCGNRNKNLESALCYHYSLVIDFF